MPLSSSSDEPYNTPNYTSSRLDTSPDHPPPRYNSINKFTKPPIAAQDVCCPWKGETYIIRDVKTKLVIALKNGKLGLYPQDKKKHKSGKGGNHGRGSHWHCVENKGMWLGFQNAISGRFIRHNNEKSNWRFDCEGKRHDDWELFVTRQHPHGGYLLPVKHWSDFLPMRALGQELAVERNTDAGTAWEFIKIN